MTSVFLPSQHDHDHCQEHILGKADVICEQKKVRLTSQRREVLAILSGSHRCLGAYDILERMSGQMGRRPAPMAVYRSLEFLITMGFVHRIGIRNAYVACTRPGHGRRAQFWICRDCGSVAETESMAIASVIPQVARDIGFDLETVNLELEGVCPDCQGGNR
ncbi:MAG: transcriptional repressor [Magnetococcales bacterium]|nr:transcriptional repressor [Magnetococcales bacterium]MBF0151699.1 transcriptional repressor [Magnetococcales bacterium]MBF0173739.1 transcriptional repressor [Magnetococcales bacterium]MBF0347701.1 transcriptional repressor [Magnetococcales bacterium]MBF0630604.1 transcriptional repressor [Magnetococcales bacterium]